MKTMKSVWPLATLPLIAFSAMLNAATDQKDDCCAPTPPAPCYTTDDCCSTYCLGPDLVNPAVRPKTCNGDFVITLAGFYWNAHQDGMAYAVDSSVSFSGTGPRGELNNLIDAEYKNPDFNWEFGFKAGLGYNSTHDGWDFGVMWTWYKGRASTHIEAEVDDNHVLLPLWSAMANFSADAGPLNATDIETHWKLALNLIDLELGREFWVSKYLTMRPHMGLRVAFIDQEWEIEHKGGSWASINTVPTNNCVDMDNDYKGVGIRGGLDTVWNFGCGFALYGNMAVSIIYGRFSIDHDESNREARANFEKTRILETEDSFRASRFTTDLALGLQWSTMFCGCYGFTLGVGWEQHMFFDQNQLWRVNRIGSTNGTGGENVYAQSRGDLDTQGWTVTVRFEF